MLMRPRPTRYADNRYWRAYLPYLPDPMRLPEEAALEESWWEWGRMRVHLDRVHAPHPRGAVIVLHGVGGYGRIVAGFGAPALAAGYDIVAPDLPGYGLTRSPRRLITFDTWVRCVRDLATLEKSRVPGPVILYGLSFGGITAYHAAATGAPVDGVIATTLADPTDPDVLASYSRFPSMSRIAVPVMRALRLLSDPIPVPARLLSKMDAISNDAGLARLCTEDPLGGGTRLPLRFWRTFTSVSSPVQPQHFRSCPVLVAHAGEDRMTEIGLSRRFAARLADKAEFVELEGAGHFPIEEPGATQLARAVTDFLARVGA